jgi:hypothetical protein
MTSFSLRDRFAADSDPSAGTAVSDK